MSLVTNFVKKAKLWYIVTREPLEPRRYYWIVYGGESISVYAYDEHILFASSRLSKRIQVTGTAILLEGKFEG